MKDPSHPQVDPADLAENLPWRFCPRCGYDLRGDDSGGPPICPECGFDYEDVLSGVRKIPWERARGFALIGAFWKTAWMVFWWPRLFCAHVCASRSYAAAHSFRILSILCMLVVVADLCRAAFAAEPGAIPIAIGLTTLATFLALIVLTGVPSFFFHPREAPVAYRNSAVALSYYAAAPLALSLPAAAILIALFKLGQFFDVRLGGVPLDDGMLVTIVKGSLVPLAAQSAWSLCRIFSASIYPQRPNRFVRHWVLMPLAQLAGVAGLVVVLVSMAFFVLVGLSLA